MKRCPCGIGPDVHEHNGHASKETKIRQAELAVIEAAEKLKRHMGPNHRCSIQCFALQELFTTLDRLKSLREKS